jgi:putative transposase
MKVRKAYKYRIYPNQQQQAALSIQFGHARFVYNWGLAVRQQAYRDNGKGLTYNDLAQGLVLMKKCSFVGWLKEADSQVLQQKLRDLNTAYQNFFEGHAKYPQFKSRKARQSIRSPQRFRVEGKKVYLPKVGWVKSVFHRPLEGEMKSCTVSKTKGGKYFISIQCEQEIDEPKYEGDEIGIDLGLIDFITASNGQTVPAPQYLRKAEGKLKRLQRRLSRCKKGSNGWQKARLALARQHEKVANQRQDFQHKLSYYLVQQNRLICFENLHIKGMLKNKRLSKSISDAGWSEFVRQCQYKGEWIGCHTEKVGRFFPSSKQCSVCNGINQTLKLSERKWLCLGCGTVQDREHNASVNIKVEGKRLVNNRTVGTTETDAGGEDIRPGLALPNQAASVKPEIQSEFIALTG